MWRPRLVDPRAVREQPAPNHRLGQARTLFARCGRSEVAQPGEALKLRRECTRCADRTEVEVFQRQSLGADGEAPGKQSVATRAFAADMVARDRHEFQRLLRCPQARQKRPAGKLADNCTLGGRTVVAHAVPLSALILPA